MRRYVPFVLALTLLAGSAAAQMKSGAPKPSGKLQQQPTAAYSVESADRITTADAVKLVAAGKAVFVDVRSKQQFDLGHIKGALSIPGSQLIARYRELPPGKKIITYCACSADQSAARAVLDLNGHGVKNTAALKGGWNLWLSEGRPTEISPR